MDTLDFSTITSGVVLTGALATIVAVGGIKIVPLATRWIVHRIATLFGK